MFLLKIAVLTCLVYDSYVVIQCLAYFLCLSNPSKKKFREDSSSQTVSPNVSDCICFIVLDVDIDENWMELGVI